MSIDVHYLTYICRNKSYVSIYKWVNLFFQENRLDVVCCMHAAQKSEPPGEGILYRIFKNLYVPFLMHRITRPTVMVIFFGILCISIATLPYIDVGLDQELSMPEDSFVHKYFRVS